MIEFLSEKERNAKSIVIVRVKRIDVKKREKWFFLKFCFDSKWSCDFFWVLSKNDSKIKSSTKSYLDSGLLVCSISVNS